MTIGVFQRFAWDGMPREEAVWWTLTKGQPPRAVCSMWSHQLGHEMRLVVKKQLVESRVVRTDAEILECQEQWRTGLEAKGWSR
jgi:hypothetical protein